MLIFCAETSCCLRKLPQTQQQPTTSHMASRGVNETAKLRSNIEEQLSRLMAQLEDIESLRDDIDEDEYESTKKETMDQLKEFNASLQKMIGGDMTLVSELGSVQLAIQAAISQAFKTPEVIKLFAKKDQGSLRARLDDLQRNVKLGKITKDTFVTQSVEILNALKKLGESLTPEQENFLAEHNTKSLQDFQQANTDIGKGAKQNILSNAAAQVKSAQK
eukprot:Phypoly_transcript_08594.p2 GENE.Phypoly_transcript_08594~~Phypoly_transcript_08594.p2  ORF type:complete len:219 (+),score=37.91 Phypoly_transcript_08594:782-1438(+)